MALNLHSMEMGQPVKLPRFSHSLQPGTIE